MLRSLLHWLRPRREVVRGGPHFLIPPRRGVVAWIAEGQVVRRGGRRIVVPTAIIELHATGVRRRRIGWVRRLLRSRRVPAR